MALLARYRSYNVSLQLEKQVPGEGLEWRQLVQLVLEAPAESALSHVAGLSRDCLTMLVPEETTAEKMVEDVSRFLNKHGWRVGDLPPP